LSREKRKKFNKFIFRKKDTFDLVKDAGYFQACSNDQCFFNPGSKVSRWLNSLKFYENIYKKKTWF